MNIRYLKKARREVKLVKNKRTKLYEVFYRDVLFYSDPSGYIKCFENKEDAEECRRKMILEYIKYFW